MNTPNTCSVSHCNPPPPPPPPAPKGSTDEERHISQSNIYILFEFGLKACKKRKRLNEDSCVTSQLQMAVVYIDYRLYASSDQTISGT